MWGSERLNSPENKNNTQDTALTPAAPGTLILCVAATLEFCHGSERITCRSDLLVMLNYWVIEKLLHENQNKHSQHMDASQNWYFLIFNTVNESELRHTVSPLLLAHLSLGYKHKLLKSIISRYIDGIRSDICKLPNDIYENWANHRVHDILLHIMSINQLQKDYTYIKDNRKKICV